MQLESLRWLQRIGFTVIKDHPLWTHNLHMAKFLIISNHLQTSSKNYNRFLVTHLGRYSCFTYRNVKTTFKIELYNYLLCSYSLTHSNPCTTEILLSVSFIAWYYRSHCSSNLTINLHLFTSFVFQLLPLDSKPVNKFKTEF